MTVADCADDQSRNANDSSEYSRLRQNLSPIGRWDYSLIVKSDLSLKSPQHETTSDLAFLIGHEKIIRTLDALPKRFAHVAQVTRLQGMPRR
jgi:hypothetical protein